MKLLSNHRKPETTLDDQIDNILTQMLTYDGHSDEVAKMSKHLELLYKLKAQSEPDKVKKAEWLAIAANLAGILLVLNHERLHVITTKSFGMLSKIRF